MSRRAPRPFSLALEGLTSELAPATSLARVQQAWEAAAGAAVAAAGRPIAERDGIVTIACADSVWAAELDMMSTRLVERLNSTIGEQIVASLRCRAN
jgi:predicted nucleic acid-binding Zn ribbon protein